MRPARAKAVHVRNRGARSVGRRSRMVHLEKLITYMKSKPGVWFATAEAIANHVKPQTAKTSQ